MGRQLHILVGAEAQAAGVEEKQETARQRTLARELEWVQSSPKARQAKSKARVAAYEKMAAEQFEDKPDELEIQIPPGKRLGQRVVEAMNLGKSYGDRVIFENVNFRLPPGGIVGIIGPNGAGKTTLLRMLMGQEQPDEGQLLIGDTVELGYVDQSRDDLKADNTIYQEISGGHDTIEMGGPQAQLAGVRGAVPVHGHGSAEEGRRAHRRRAQPRASRQIAAAGIKRAAAR